MNNKTRQTIERISNIKYKIILEGIGVGLLTGLLVSLFRMTLTKAETIRWYLLDLAHSDVKWCLVIVLVMIACYWIVLTCYHMVPLCSGSGIPQVKGELKGAVEQQWIRIIVAKFIGGVAAIGAGLSLGREGPSIQLGAMVGKGFSKLTNRLRTEEKLLMTCGASAGLSGAFCAPLAGVVFSLEELHKNFSTEILLSTMAASITSDFVASYIFGLEPVFHLNVDQRLPLNKYWMVIAVGIILGMLGVFYNWFTARIQDAYDKISLKPVKILIPFVFVGILAAIYPIVLGSGNSLVNRVATGEFAIKALIVLLIVKFIFSIVSFGSGSPGGIFLPLLVLGAIIGGLFASSIGQITGDGDVFVANFVILGMTGYFASIVRSPITGVILITEMTGDFRNFLSLAIVALVSYLVADILNGQPIYDQLLERMLSKNSEHGTSEETRNKKVLIEWDVYYGSYMDGNTIDNIRLPKGCLIVSVQREHHEIVPSGSTVIEGGDKIVILCAERQIRKIEERLSDVCCNIK